MKTFKNSILALALLSVGVVACDGADAGSDLSTSGREEVTVPAPASEPADVTPFLGLWAYGSGSATSTCGSHVATREVSSADGSVQIAAGEKPGTISVRDGACSFSASVSGTEAFAEPGVTCEGLVGTPSIVYSLAGRTMRKLATSAVTAGKFGVVCSTREDATLFAR